MSFVKAIDTLSSVVSVETRQRPCLPPLFRAIDAGSSRKNSKSPRFLVKRRCGGSQPEMRIRPLDRCSHTTRCEYATPHKCATNRTVRNYARNAQRSSCFPRRLRQSFVTAPDRRAVGRAGHCVCRNTGNRTPSKLQANTHAGRTRQRVVGATSASTGMERALCWQAAAILGLAGHLVDVLRSI